MVDAQLNMNLFDAVVFSVLFLSALISFFRGFIREFLSLLAWIGAALITLYCVVDVAEFLKPYVKKDSIALIFATMGTYFLTLLSFSLIGAIITKYLRSGDDVGKMDNFIGMFFGFIKGFIIIILGFVIMNLVMGKKDYPEWVQTAYTLPAVEKGSRIMARMMPAYLKDVMHFTKPEGEEPFDMNKPIPPEYSADITEDPDGGYEKNDLLLFDQLLKDSTETQNAE